MKGAVLGFAVRRRQEDEGLARVYPGTDPVNELRGAAQGLQPVLEAWNFSGSYPQSGHV